jgi:hypothetical protein
MYYEDLGGVARKQAPGRLATAPEDKNTGPKACASPRPDEFCKARKVATGGGQVEQQGPSASKCKLQQVLRSADKVWLDDCIDRIIRQALCCYSRKLEGRGSSRIGDRTAWIWVSRRLGSRFELGCVSPCTPVLGQPE